jgi:ectoine hydroxylase-related dioxygenase (phytanoyl-CoA dioxygenase family)
MKLTPEQYELLPSSEDVEFYRQHGYYVSKRIFSDDEIDEAIYGSERFYSGERDFSVPPSIKPFEGWKPENGDDGIRINDYVSLQNAEILSLMLNPVLGAIAARLSGSNTIRLWHDQMIFKPTDTAGNKTNIGWHTDRAYWKTCSSANMLTAWIPFQTCDESMGPLMAIDGSHRLTGNGDLRHFHTSDQTGLQDHFAADRRAARIPLNLEKGQVSFHHCLTIHGSGANRNSNPRHSISVHLQDASNRYQAYTYSNGERAWHRNDVLCRTINGKPDYTDPDFCPVIWSDGEGEAA